MSRVGSSPSLRGQPLRGLGAQPRPPRLRKSSLSAAVPPRWYRSAHFASIAGRRRWSTPRAANPCRRTTPRVSTLARGARLLVDSTLRGRGRSGAGDAAAGLAAPPVERALRATRNVAAGRRAAGLRFLPDGEESVRQRGQASVQKGRMAFCVPRPERDEVSVRQRVRSGKVQRLPRAAPRRGAAQAMLRSVIAIRD